MSRRRPVWRRRRGQTARLQGAGGGDGFFQGRRGGLLDGGRVGTGQNQHILAAGVVVLIKGHSLAESRLFDLLVQFGQLTAERDRAVAPKAAARSSSVPRSLCGAS